MTPTPVGTSELPGRTFGKVQVMSNVQAGWNLVAALEELEREHGEIVTVNEADRSRPDQWLVREDYLYRNGPLAAYCVLGPHPYEYIKGTWTSTHDPGNHGNAADLGGPDGAVISENARQLLDGNHPRGVIGRKYGLYNTGWFFSRREVWHFNIYPARASVLAPKPVDTIAPAPIPPELYQEDTLLAFRNRKNGALLGIDTQYIKHCDDERDFEMIVKSTPGNKAQETDENTLKAILRGRGIPEMYVDPVLILRDADEKGGRVWSAVGQLRKAIKK